MVSVLVSFTPVQSCPAGCGDSAKRLAMAMYGHSGTLARPTAKRVEGFNPLVSSNLTTSAMTRGNAPPEGSSGGAFSALLGGLVSFLVSIE